MPSKGVTHFSFSLPPGLDLVAAAGAGGEKVRSSSLGFQAGSRVCSFRRSNALTSAESWSNRLRGTASGDNLC